MTDVPQVVGDLEKDATVRYYGGKRVVHLADVDCMTQRLSGPGSTKAAKVLFNDRPICKQCQDRCSEDETAALGQEGAE
jgi:hypothetical protein